MPINTSQKNPACQLSQAKVVAWLIKKDKSVLLVTVSNCAKYPTSVLFDRFPSSFAGIKCQVTTWAFLHIGSTVGVVTRFRRTCTVDDRTSRVRWHDLDAIERVWVISREIVEEVLVPRIIRIIEEDPSRSIHLAATT